MFILTCVRKGVEERYVCMYTDTRAVTCVDMCTGMRVDLWTGMCLGMCVCTAGMCVDISA